LFDLSSSGGVGHWPRLLGLAPIAAIIQEDQFVTCSSSAHELEELRTFVGQSDVIFRFVSVTLSRSDAQGSDIRIEIRHDKLRQLAVPRACLKRSLHQRAKIGIACVDQPLGFVDRQIPKPGLVHAFEGVDLAPCDVRRNLAIVEGVVERGLQDCRWLRESGRRWRNRVGALTLGLGRSSGNG
jgi:hypothetical protein